MFGPNIWWIKENKMCDANMPEIHWRDRYRSGSSRPIERRISFEYIFVMMFMREKSYTRIYAPEIKRRTQTNWNVLGRARASADFRRHSRYHQSSISVYQTSGRRIYCDARVDRTHETEIDAVPGRCITDTLRGPSSIQTFLTRCDQSS